MKVHGNFKGGVHVDDRGWLRISAGPHRDVRVATLVAEAMLGRKLKPSEDVDHRDRDRLNCEWTNLIVRDHTEHGYVSSKQRWYVETVILPEQDKEWKQYLKEKDEIDGTDFGFSTAVEGSGKECTVDVRRTDDGSEDGGVQRPVQRKRKRDVPVPAAKAGKFTRRSGASRKSGHRSAPTTKVACARQK